MSGVKLSDFEGLEVTQSSIEIPDAAGGLRSALKVDPVELHKGDRVYIALECEVAKVRFDPVEKEKLTGSQARVHVFRTVSAAIVGKELVGDALVAQAERIAQAKEIEGQQKAGTAAPWLGYDDLTVDEVLERIDECDSSDADTINQLELYEQANGGRSKIIKAIAEWREAGR